MTSSGSIIRPNVYKPRLRRWPARAVPPSRTAAAAFWKLNESSGTTAADSSGNGYDLAAAAAGPPRWAQPPGPPGEQSADFTGGRALARAAFPALGVGVEDTAARGWATFIDNDPADSYTLVGQGNAGGAFGSGWQVAVVGGSGANPHRLVLYVGDGAHAGNEVIYSNGALAQNVWFAWAVVHEGGTWRMYVNGAAQAATSTRTNSGAAGIYVGGDPASIASYHLDGRESYVSVYSSAATP
jgi:hypothetical protein